MSRRARHSGVQKSPRSVATDHHAPPIRVAIADTHPVLREGLRKLLEAESGFVVIGQAADGAEAVRMVRRLRPDVLMLDAGVSRVSGGELLRELSRASSTCRVILVGGAPGRDENVEALHLGARGVVTKDTTAPLVFKSIRTVMKGQYWIGRESISALIGSLQPGAPARQGSRPKFGLTRRELQIVAAVVAGYANKEIAVRLSLSEHTVKHHLSSIFHKLGVSTRLEVALFSIQHRLVDGAEPGA
jgi:two-component system, NarL family, nitrate/nitrite response regulator NarL